MSNKVDELIVYDSRGEKPFTIINIDTRESRQFGSWGRGPGEITPRSAITLRFADGQIYAYDMVTQMIHLFTDDGTYLRSYSSPPEFMMGFLHIFDDENMFFRSEFSADPGSRKYWLQKASLNSGNWGKTNQGVLSLDFDESFKSIRNNATLSFGPVSFHNSGKVYVASLYSTLLSGYELDGTKIFETFSPERFPVQESELTIRANFVTGEPERSVFHAIDTTVDDNFIYMLYSGQEYDYQTVSGVLTHGGGELPEDIRPGESRELRVFSSSDGGFKASYSLPVWANAIEEVGDYLYLVSWDEPVGIYRIKKSELDL
ncbi:MAG: hypothetical protein LAT84_11145 [Balneolia bacterium]|nr:hypothetical protein [Balneolia bacterium]